MIRYGLALFGAMLLVVPPVLAQSFQHDFRLCFGDFALCAASTCTPIIGGTIEVNTATGTAPFPAASCLCPIFSGSAIADVNGGNMQGSCDPPLQYGSQGVWSLYWPTAHIPQDINNWSRSSKKSAAPAQVCPASLKQGNQLANCFSFACIREPGKIHGVEVATCFCPLGESLEGTAVPANTAFGTQAGQCNEDICFQHPVSAPLGFDDIKEGACLQIPDTNLGAKH